MVRSEVDINYYMCGFMVTCHCSSLRAVLSHARCTPPTASFSDSWLMTVIYRCSVKYFVLLSRIWHLVPLNGRNCWPVDLEEEFELPCVTFRETSLGLGMYFCVLLYTYIWLEGQWWLRLWDILYINISDVVNVGFVLHVYVHRFPLSDSG